MPIAHVTVTQIESDSFVRGRRSCEREDRRRLACHALSDESRHAQPGWGTSEGNSGHSVALTNSRR
jgi:hypothetical protein